jgi:hypothetical protein
MHKMGQRDDRTVEQIFDEEEWQRLRKVSGLPDNYRTDVEDVVRFLRDKPSLKHPFAAESQQDRENNRNALEALHNALPAIDRLVQSGAGYVFRPLTVGPDNDADAVSAKGDIAKLHNLMKRVADDLKYSERRLPYVRPGRFTAHLTQAVRTLNEIAFNATGRSLNQKKKSRSGISLSEFVLQVCRKADASLKIETIPLGSRRCTIRNNGS